MPKINLTPITQQWLTNKIQKTAARYLALPENIARKQEAVIKHWQLLNRKFEAKAAEPANEDGTRSYVMKRVEIKSLQSMVLEAIVFLNSKTIPEYAERMERVPERAEHYREYKERAEQLVKDLAQVLEEINKAI